MNSKPALIISGLALRHPHVGQGVYSLRLIEGLARRIPGEFLVVAPDDIQRPSTIAEDHFLQMPAVRAPRHALINHVLTSDRLLHFVKKNFPAAIFHSPGPILGRTMPDTTIVTLHDCLYRHFSNYDGRFHLRRILMGRTEKFAARASLVLTDSEYSRRDLVSQAQIPANKIEVLYPWVGNDFLAPADQEAVRSVRRKFQLPAHFWLYLGGYDYRKNVTFLIESYAAALSHRTFPPLVLAGEITRERNRATCDVLGALQKTGLKSGQIILPGPVSHADLPHLYRAASLLIYPSLMEGFGLPPAEAMAVGTPVLAANNSSLPEVVQQTDCLFSASQPEELKEKLLAAADGETRFVSPLLASFTESSGIDRYLQLIGKPAAQK